MLKVLYSRGFVRSNSGVRCSRIIVQGHGIIRNCIHFIQSSIDPPPTLIVKITMQGRILDHPTYRLVNIIIHVDYIRWYPLCSIVHNNPTRYSRYLRKFIIQKVGQPDKKTREVNLLITRRARNILR